MEPAPAHDTKVLRIIRPPEPDSGFSLAPASRNAPPPAATTPARVDPMQDARGIQCKACGCCHFRVVYTRQVRGGRIKRRRQCMNAACGREITTYEREAAP